MGHSLVQPSPADEQNGCDRSDPGNGGAPWRRTHRAHVRQRFERSRGFGLVTADPSLARGPRFGLLHLALSRDAFASHGGQPTPPCLVARAVQERSVDRPSYSALSRGAVNQIWLKLVAAVTFPAFAFAAACAGNEPAAQSPTSAAASPAVSSRPSVTATQPTSGTGSTPAMNADATPAAPVKPTPVLSLRDAGFLTPESVCFEAGRLPREQRQRSASAADNKGSSRAFRPMAKWSSNGSRPARRE